MLSATAAAALVAVAAVMLAGAGVPAGAAPVAASASPARLPAAGPGDAVPGDGSLGGADAASVETAEPVAVPTIRTAASSRQQTAQQATSSGPQAPRVVAQPAVHAAAPAATLAPTAVDGTPCTSTAKACVDVANRLAWLIDKGVVTRGPVQVMTGDQDDPTPIGTFHVQWKAEQYTSRQYLTQMPYSVFFADGGVAFHEGPQQTYSAGCVKLVHDDAVAWFNYLQVGDEVQVH